MSAYSYDGKVVKAGDSVSIIGTCSAISGSGPLASLTVVTNYGDSITVKANDCTAPQGIPTSTAAVSIDGKAFTLASQVTILGVVTAVSGSGQNAQLTVTLASSGNSITVSAGSVRGTSQV